MTKKHYHDTDLSTFDKVTFRFHVQVMTEEQARKMPYNPFDLTKVWYKSEFPLIEVGEFELNRNPDNYFADVEQAAFAPTNIVPGIGFSPDKMLQGRLFSYGDTQRYRLGVNHHQIPVNYPKAAKNYCPFHRDGAMRVDGNQGGTIGYEPNSYGEWQDQSEYKEPPLQLDGDAYEWNFREDDDDYYTQPGKLFRLMSSGQKQVLFENTARNMQGTTKDVQLRHIGNCYRADPAYGEGVASELGIPMSEVEAAITTD